MPSTYVVHWQNPRYIGLTAVQGDERALAREIMAGDTFTADQIRMVERYDSEEGWSQLVLMGDVARALAMRAHIEQPSGGTITSEVRDFIHDHAGAAYARGLHIRGSAYEAA